MGVLGGVSSTGEQRFRVGDRGEPLTAAHITVAGGTCTCIGCSFGGKIYASISNRKAGASIGDDNGGRHQMVHNW